MLTYIVYIVLYTEAKLFLYMIKINQRMQAYNIYVTRTLTIRMIYPGYARLRHMLNTTRTITECDSYPHQCP